MKLHLYDEEKGYATQVVGEQLTEKEVNPDFKGNNFKKGDSKLSYSDAKKKKRKKDNTKPNNFQNPTETLAESDTGTSKGKKKEKSYTFADQKQLDALVKTLSKDDGADVIANIIGLAKKKKLTIPDALTTIAEECDAGKKKAKKK